MDGQKKTSGVEDPDTESHKHSHLIYKVTSSVVVKYMFVCFK